LVQFEKETKEPFIEVEIGDQQFEKKKVELGLSDGINVEVISGVKESDRIKVWNRVEEPVAGNPNRR
jgi:HlyD family secretion protein